MTDSNPYRQPAEPSKSPDQSENNELDDASAATPGGIKLIACFYFLLSLGSLVAAMMVVEGRVLLFLTAAACIAAGVGLWRGAKWSWWIAIFYHCWFGIWDKLESVSGLRGEDVAASINYNRFLPMLLLHFVAVYYLLGSEARKHLRTEGIAAWKPLLLSFVAGFLLAVLLVAVAAALAPSA